MDAPTAPAPRPKRRLLGCLFKGPLGCLAFFVGLLGTLGLLLPFGLSKALPGVIQGEVSDAIEGRVEVQRLELGWLERQGLGLVLREPTGPQVVEFEVEVPSLVELGRGAGSRFGRTDVRFQIDLVTEADGVSNLDRALRRVSGSDDSGGAVRAGTDEDPGDGVWDWRDLLDRSGELRIESSRIRWVDRSGAGPERQLALEGIEGRALLMPDEELRFELAANLIEPGPEQGSSQIGRIDFELSFGEPARIRREGLTPRLDFSAAGLPVDLLDALAGLEGALVEALGERLDVTAVGAGALRFDGSSEGSLSLALSGAQRGAADLEFELDERRVRIVKDAARPGRPRLDWTFGAALLQRLLPVELAARLELRVGQERPLTARIQQFELLLGEDFLERSSRERWPALVEALELDVELGLPNVAADGPLLRERGLGAGLALEDLDLRLRHTGRSGLQVYGGGELQLGGPAGPAGFDLSLRGPGLDRSGAADSPPPIDGTIELVRVPAAFADALAESGTLIGDVLGPELELDVVLDQIVGTESGQVDLHFRSARASARLAGRLAGQSFVSDGLQLAPDGGDFGAAGLDPGRSEPGAGGSGSSVAFELRPEAVRSLVNPLLPMLASVRAGRAEQRAVLDLESFSLPLDGDLARLSAELVLDLGEVRLDLLPALLQGVPQLLELRSLQRELEPLRLTIVDGRVSYTDLGLNLGEQRLAFDGVVDLAQREFDLTTTLPLELFGGRAGEWFGRAGAGIDPQAATRVRIVGRPNGVEVEGPDLGELLRDAVAPGSLAEQAARLAQERLAEELETNEELQRVRDELERLGLDGLQLEGLDGAGGAEGLGGVLNWLRRPRQQQAPPPPLPEKP